MFSWQRATSSFLDAIGLHSIKSKIIAFALLATLIPSISMGWLSYRNNRQSIDEKISGELTSLTSHAARELELWLRERLHEIKVLSSSVEVTANLAALGRPDLAEPVRASTMARLQDYVESIGGKFAEYEQLTVVDGQGNVVVGGAAPSGPIRLSGRWLQENRSGGVIGSPYRAETSGRGVMLMAEPIRSADGTVLGAMAATVNFVAINRILSMYTDEPSHELYLVTQRGEILASSWNLDGAFMDDRLGSGDAARLFSQEMALLEFSSFRGAPVLGALNRVAGLPWGIIAERDRAAAYAAVDRMRNFTLLLIFSVLLVIGLAAYLLGLTIVRPLDHLTQGAGRIAVGDLDVKLSQHDSSEVGYLTEVFNDMATRLRAFHGEKVAIAEALREKNEELHALSATDGLTGLYNRMHLPAMLSKELSRSQRHGHPFSILMIDIDHFKHFNDTHGHQAGDDILQKVGELLRTEVRACDIAARYGGEEFLVLLTETGPKGALRFAEKIRQTVDKLSWQEEHLTVSVGAASFPEHGDDVESVIREADVALYRSKRGGRNQVSLAEKHQQPEATLRD